jgi:hypothetical protein
MCEAYTYCECAILPLYIARITWLNGTFPKFASKTRLGKASSTGVVPPPHTTKLLSRCSLDVGPHIMSELMVYEVHYSSAASPTLVPGAVSTSTTSEHPSGTRRNAASHSSLSQRASTPLVSSLSSRGATTDLVARVNAAAALNPTLAEYIQLATAGRATPDQIQYLAAFIDTLGIPDIPPPPPPVREPDIIFEFKEKSMDRWLLPKVPVLCERVPPNGTRLEAILLSVALPFPQVMEASAEPPPAGTSSEKSIAVQEVVTLRFSDPTQLLYDSLVTWAGGLLKMEEHREILNAIVRVVSGTPMIFCS